MLHLAYAPAMSATRLLGIVAAFAVFGALAYFYGQRQNTNARELSRAFIVGARQQFATLQRAGEMAPAWVIIAGDLHGALGLTDQRLLLLTTSSLETIERSDVTSMTALAKNYGGAHHLWGHEITIVRRDGRRHVLLVIDAAEYLPPEHDASTVLARMAA